jgi:GTP-binding protein Era
MLFEPKEPLRPVELEMAESLKTGGAAVAAVNKADPVRLGEDLIQKVEELKALGVFREVFVVSAATGEGCPELLESIARYAAPGPHYFADDAFTDQPEKQLAAELIREKLLLFLQEEIPHGTAVEVERFHERKGGQIIDIDATIYCEKKSHKGIIIGKNGQMLKQIAIAARADCQDLLGTQVNLQCWVKVREKWRDNEAMLGRMGFK